MVSSSAAFGGGEILQFKRRYPHPLEKQVNVCCISQKSGEIHPKITFMLHYGIYIVK